MTQSTKGFSFKLAVGLASLVREQLTDTFNGFKLVDVRMSTSTSTFILTMESEGGHTWQTFVTLESDEYNVWKALGRNDVRTPGPSSGPMVPEAVPWSRPHEKDDGNLCNGDMAPGGLCEVAGCGYNGEWRK